VNLTDLVDAGKADRTASSIARASLVLPRSSECQGGNNREEILTQYQGINGAPGKIRTSDPPAQSRSGGSLRIDRRKFDVGSGETLLGFGIVQ
jgi:hypothetical protein